MSYIGNSPTNIAFLTDTFSGTGSQTAFTMSVAPANTTSVLVAVTGVLQDPSTYSVSGTTLTFSAAPPSGTSNISVRYLGIPASGVTTTAYRTVTNFTATAGQTSFSTPSYTVGYIDVYRNGVYLPTSDYTATTGTTVVLNNGATAGDTITTSSFYVSSVLNALPQTGGTLTGQLVVNGATGQNPLITQVNSTEVMRIDSSGNVGIGTSSPSYKVEMAITSGSNFYSATTSATGQDIGYRLASTAASGREYRISTSDPTRGTYGAGLAFIDQTAGAARMLIDSSGNLLVGTTTTGGGLFKVQAATDVCLAVASGPGVTGAITLNAINNANSNNIPFDIRASAIYSSTGIGTTASAANAYFNNAATNQFLRSTSALKYKTNIRDLESIDVNKFRPVRYNSLCEADDKTKEHFGIIADEVDAAGIKELVTYGEDNQIEGFQYERLTVVLLKAIQEQQALITQLQADVAALKGKA